VAQLEGKASLPYGIALKKRKEEECIEIYKGGGRGEGVTWHYTKEREGV
jgi:hypothetical protein